MNKHKKIIKFKNEKEEFKFWSKAESTDYIDPASIRRGVFPNLKPTSRAIPFRLPVSLLEKLMVKAHKCGVPYQSLMKVLIVRGLKSL